MLDLTFCTNIIDLDDIIEAVGSLPKIKYLLCDVHQSDVIVLTNYVNLVNG